MFDLFNRRTAKDYLKEAEDTYKVPAPKPTPKTSPSNELYRIGVTDDGRTTLTMMSTDGFSMTLSMNKEACERMIRMLRATYLENKHPFEETSE